MVPTGPASCGRVIRRELLQRVSEWWVGAARSWIFQMLPALRYWIFQILSARFGIFLILPAKSMNISNFAGKILNFPNLAGRKFIQPRFGYLMVSFATSRARDTQCSYPRTAAKVACEQALLFGRVKAPCLVLKTGRVKWRVIKAQSSNIGFFARLNSTG